ncbi:Chymotrypsin-like elastase family member 2A [Trichinella murrelli]|uniref:Acrosin n=1 Tax=Trichinella murrelli TaxID=144512 RepID=A0A0V0UH80_9BILA|nr:Chymotrypsin-like elastase family member 2A [Trichinella murrelli]
MNSVKFSLHSVIALSLAVHMEQQISANVCLLKCGEGPSQSKLDGVKGNRIVNGARAIPHAFPWLAHITIESKRKKLFPDLRTCTGSLIDTPKMTNSSVYVVTAAHCFRNNKGPFGNPQIAHVRFASYDMSMEEPLRKKRTSAKIITHEGYQKYQVSINDIALVKLTKPIPYSSYVRSICLPQSGDKIEGKACYFAGWGRTIKGSALSSGKELMYASYEKFQETGNMIYTLDKNAASIAKGDSGGPLMCIRPGEKTWVQHGVASVSISDLTNVFTRVSSFTSWITYKLEEK